MNIRLYTSLDTGAPVLSGSQFSRVRQILLACLVNGYGGKPAAGWTVGHDVAGGFSLFNGVAYINFVEGSSVYTHAAYIMEAITDGTTALAGGVNRRSAGWYDGATVNERQGWYTGSSGLNSTSNPYWLVAADDKTVIFAFGGGTTTADLPGGSGGIHYFGQYINASGLTGAGAFCSLGGNMSDGSSTLTFLNYGGRYGTSLRNPFTGLVAQGDAARYGAGVPMHFRGSVQQSTAPRLPLSRLQSVRGLMFGYGGNLGVGTQTSQAAVAGYLRGVVAEPTLASVPLSQVMSLMGRTNTWQNRVTPFALPNGVQWAPLYAISNDLGAFVSLSPSDWE